MARGILPTSLSAYCWLVPSLAELLEGQGPFLPLQCLLEPQPLASLFGEPIKAGPGTASRDPESVAQLWTKGPVFGWSWGSAGQATWPFAQQLQCDLGRSLASLA